MATFTTYAGSDVTTLTAALLAPSSGITINPLSILLNASGQEAVNFYDGTLVPLGIGAGLLLTSGTTPGLVNTVGWFGTDNSALPGGTFYNGDADIDAVVNTVFKTQSYDATTLSFDFTVTDPTATSVSFDLVFGSDEFPEWVDQFVDSAIVMVNGVNYALFNHDPLHPLSVVSSNLAAGYFQDNAGNAFPIEYDGVSHVLKIVAPIIPGATNHIKIGIADTGDHIYDSGIFIANLSAGNIPGSGVVSSTTGTGGNDTLTGSAQAEYFDLQGGDDTVYAGAGDDIVVAGSGNDLVYGGSGADEMKGDAGYDYLDGGADSDTAVYAGVKADYAITFDSASGKYTVTANPIGPSSSEATDTLTSVEFAKFSDGLWSMDATGTVSQVSSTGTVTPPSNQPGTVFLSGIGAQGQTLTANVADADGVPASGVIYTWQANGAGLVDVNGNLLTGNTFVVSEGQVGQNISVTASYTDLANYSELLASAAKYISAPGNGDFTITLLNLSAPIGASVMNPLTTLVKNAIDLGVSPNEAGIIIKSALGIAATVDLQHYDSWAVLQAYPGDTAALAVEKKSVQVAVMTSLGGDDTGMALTQAILLAHSNNTTLDLTDTSVIASALGLVPANPADPQDPVNKLVHEIWDRNDNIGSANNVAQIETIWADMQSGLNVVLSGSIGTLSVHINQVPTGSATASLVNGLEDTAYIINASDLLQGFSDADGDTLSVSGLSADNGAVVNNLDGSFTISPTLNFIGPEELTYTVLDGQGGSASANQLFVIVPNQVTPVNTAPIGAASATLAAGTEDTAYTVNASDLLAGFSDIDGDTLSVSGLTASDGAISTNPDGSFTVTPTANFNGAVSLNYNVLDGQGGSVAATQSYTLAAVNDAPALTGIQAALAAGTEDTAYTVSTANLLAGFSDVDGDTLSVSGLTASNGTIITNPDGSFTITPSLHYSGPVTLNYSVTDGTASIAALQGYTLAALPGVTLTGTAKADILNGTAHDDTLYGLGGNDTLNGLAGKDTLVGGAGNDTYVVDSAGDVVTEAANAGTDLVQSSITYTLSANVENLTLTGTAAINANGNALANTLTGNSGDNVLDGLRGHDTMLGGAGDDTYYVDDTGDTVTEVTGAGADTIHSTLAAYSLGANVENLVLDGSAANGTGNSLANILFGNSAANVLSGLAGNDLLYGLGGNDTLLGGAGNDELWGGSGNDIFRFDNTALSATTNHDTIHDFNTIDDSIQLENAIFTSLKKTGTLSALNFWSSIGGTTAPDTNDFILYYADSGALYYDADGAGTGAAAIQFATLIADPSQTSFVVTAADFIVT